MLVLSRKLGERIHIGDNITFQVVAVMGNRVKIGVDAPRHIEIRREELCARDFVCDRGGPKAKG